jgi:hypothetical protein
MRLQYRNSSEIEIDSKRFTSLAALRTEYRDVMTRAMKNPCLQVQYVKLMIVQALTWIDSMTN